MLAELFNMCFPDCWKISSVVPVIKNVSERSTTEHYPPVGLVINQLVDNLEKQDLFLISSMVSGLLV